jgi:hypothetical protein
MIASRPSTLPDQRQGLRFIAGAAAAFFDKGDRSIDLGCEVARLFGKTQISADHHRILHLGLKLLDMLFEDMESGQHISGYGEETLNLPGVQVEGHITVSARDHDHIGYQAGRDRNPRLVRFIRAGITHIGKDSRYPPG